MAAEHFSEEWLQNVAFIDQRERDLFIEARFGELVRGFLTGQVGQYLHQRANNVVEEAKTKILQLEVEADDFRRRYSVIQREAWNGEHFMKWLADALQSGDNAAHQLDIENDEDLFE